LDSNQSLANDYLIQEPPPYTGNGFVASLDGRLRPEYHLGRSTPNGMSSPNADIGRDLPLGAVVTKRSSTGQMLKQAVYERNAENVLVWRQVFPAP
jgi:hypothetical protein